jgi:hypothetical protein
MPQERMYQGEPEDLHKIGKVGPARQADPKYNNGNVPDALVTDDQTNPATLQQGTGKLREQFRGQQG